jgi:hypothetical protein
MNSIVDFLKSQAKDSSFAARTQLATQYGMQGYTGKAEENLNLLSLLQKGAAPVAPAAPTLPVTPPAPTAVSDPYKTQAKTAGAAGLNLNETAALFGATPEEQKIQKDSLAQTFGFGSFDEFAKDTFTKPSKTTEQFYREAYSAAGLDQLLAKINERKNQLAQAEGSINDNPWLSEASRAGRARRLQELASADIQNWQDAYNLGLDQVKNLVSANAQDIGQDERMREARFNYLLKAAEEGVANKGTQRLSTYLPEYLAGRTSTQEPKTVNVSEGNSVYQWNPTSGAFELLASKPKTYAPKAASSAKTTTKTASTSNKVVTAFRSALANRAALNRAKSREQFIRELQAKFKEIDPSDIARAVYETYPDNYER